MSRPPRRIRRLNEPNGKPSVNRRGSPGTNHRRAAKSDFCEASRRRVPSTNEEYSGDLSVGTAKDMTPTIARILAIDNDPAILAMVDRVLGERYECVLA